MPPTIGVHVEIQTLDMNLLRGRVEGGIGYDNPAVSRLLVYREEWLLVVTERMGDGS
jgi:hypothetical protein